MIITFLSMLLAGPSLLAAPEPDVEAFDLSGFPEKAAAFQEQLIRECVKDHPAGDLADAVRLQQRLAAYYDEKKDAARAALCRERAASGERLLAERARPAEPETPAEPAPPAGKKKEEDPAPKPASTGWSGKYFAMDGRTLHTWDFADDGTYLCTTVASGAGTSVRNSERGTYRLELKKGKGDIVLTAKSEAGGFVTPGVGQGTLLGGGGGAKDETRRLTLEFKGEKGSEGIVLAGKSYKPKSW